AGHTSEALACAEEAMDSLAQDRTLGIDLLGYNPYSMLADIRADLLFFVGRTAECVQWFESAIQQAPEDHDPYMIGVLCADYGGVCSSWLGDSQAALAHARQGVEPREKAWGNPRANLCLHAGIHESCSGPIRAAEVAKKLGLPSPREVRQTSPRRP